MQNKKNLPIWVGGLFVVSVLTLAFAAGLEIEGLARARQEQIESHEWPSVSATVMDCYLDRDYPFQGDGGGVIYGVRCHFAYSVDSVVYQTMVKIPGNHHSIRDPAQLPSDAIELETWAKLHKRGSLQTIHYDPINPARASLAGADDTIRSNTAAIALTSAKQAAVLGAIVLGLGLVAYQMKLK